MCSVYVSVSLCGPSTFMSVYLSVRPICWSVWLTIRFQVWQIANAVITGHMFCSFLLVAVLSASCFGNPISRDVTLITVTDRSRFQQEVCDLQKMSTSKWHRWMPLLSMTWFWKLYFCHDTSFCQATKYILLWLYRMLIDIHVHLCDYSFCKSTEVGIYTVILEEFFFMTSFNAFY